MIIYASNLQDFFAKSFKISQKYNAIVIISDNHVAKLDLTKQFIKYFKEQRLNTHEIYIKPGEASKTRENKALIEDKLFSLGCDRSSLLIALGGGVIGDLVGFVASTFMRGIKYIQIPTTLLAMVDSAIGGKVAVNTQYGKNLIGAFWPASATIIYQDFLKTLTHNELKSGFMEIVKIALVTDHDFFIKLCDYSIDFSDKLKLLNFVKQAIVLKQNIVEQDPKDQGIRTILNFGHTLGHALEKITDYQMLHGIAVAYGCLFAAQISLKLSYLNLQQYQLISDFFAKWQINLSDLKIYDFAKLHEIMRHDKKNQQQKIHMVLLQDIGQALVVEQQFSHPVHETILSNQGINNVG